MKLCMSRCRPKFQVWPLSQHATISSHEFRKPARRSFGGGFVLCQTTNWNVSKTGSNDLVPAAEQVVAREREQRAGRLEDAAELGEPRRRLERRLVPAATSLLNDFRQLMSMLPVE